MNRLFALGLFFDQLRNGLLTQEVLACPREYVSPVNHAEQILEAVHQMLDQLLSDVETDVFLVPEHGVDWVKDLICEYFQALGVLDEALIDGLEGFLDLLFPQLADVDSVLDPEHIGIHRLLA